MRRIQNYGAISANPPGFEELEDAPHWAKYAALDRNGLWCFYRVIPTINYKTGRWETKNDSDCFSVAMDIPVWTMSLMRIGKRIKVGKMGYKLIFCSDRIGVRIEEVDRKKIICLDDFTQRSDYYVRIYYDVAYMYYPADWTDDKAKLTLLREANLPLDKMISELTEHKAIFNDLLSTGRKGYDQAGIGRKK